jgi:hypothetical protein
LYIGESGKRRRPSDPAPDEMLMMRGLDALRNKGIRAFVSRYGPVALMSKEFCNLSRSVPPDMSAIAALLIRTSSLPWDLVMCDAASAICSSRWTSRGRNSMLPGSFRDCRSSNAALPFCEERADSKTWYVPRARSWWAISKPMPLFAVGC